MSTCKGRKADQDVRDETMSRCLAEPRDRQRARIPVGPHGAGAEAGWRRAQRNVAHPHPVPTTEARSEGTPLHDTQLNVLGDAKRCIFVYSGRYLSTATCHTHT